MTPNKKIDCIFFFLKNRSDISASFSKEYVWNLYVAKTPELNINRQVYDEIFKKLVDDGYIREQLIQDAQPVYHLTFKGLLFDGYNKTQTEIRRLSRQTFFLSCVIAFGTLVAAIYYTLEILNHWFCIYPRK